MFWRISYYLTHFYSIQSIYYKGSCDVMYDGLHVSFFFLISLSYFLWADWILCEKTLDCSCMSVCMHFMVICDHFITLWLLANACSLSNPFKAFTTVRWHFQNSVVVASCPKTYIKLILSHPNS